MERPAVVRECARGLVDDGVDLEYSVSPESREAVSRYVAQVANLAEMLGAYSDAPGKDNRSQAA